MVVAQRVVEPTVVANMKGAALTVVANHTMQIVMFVEDIVAAEPEYLPWCVAIALSAEMTSPAILSSALLVASAAAAE